MNYYKLYLESGHVEFEPFNKFMETISIYKCKTCNESLLPVNLKEASEINCPFVYVHNDNIGTHYDAKGNPL